jgi:hypothetical protein
MKTLILLVLVLLTDCRGHMAWVEEQPIVNRVCKGGTINTERRIVASTIDGRIRNTTTRVDACLD